MLEDGDVGERVAIYEQQVGEVVRSDLPDGEAHQLSAVSGCGDESFAGAEAKQIDEQLEVACVATNRVVREPVVTTGQDTDTAPV